MDERKKTSATEPAGAAEPDVLRILLELPGEAARKEKTIRLKRLSEAAGRDVNFRLRSLGYDRTAEIVREHPDDMSLFVVLEGVASPSFKDRELMSHYGAATPVELIKKLLLPGEIEDISREVQRLSGYLAVTYEAVEKK
jgi:hypothetical protein